MHFGWSKEGLEPWKDTPPQVWQKRAKFDFIAKQLDSPAKVNFLYIPIESPPKGSVYIICSPVDAT